MNPGVQLPLVVFADNVQKSPKYWDRQKED